MGARQVDEETIRRWISEGIGDSPGGSSYWEKNEDGSPGVSGSFLAQSGETITVTNGLITAITPP